MNYIDNKILKRHMDSCEECRLIHEKIDEGNKLIKEEILDMEVPASLTINVVSANIGTNRKRHLTASLVKYTAAAAAIFIIGAAVFFLTKASGNGNPTVTPVTDPSKQETTVNKDTTVGADLESVLKDYIKAEEGVTSKDGQVFVSVDIFGSREDNETIKVYLWALVQEYGWADDLIEGSGSSIPMMIEVKRNGDKYEPMSITMPRDGGYYTEDLKKIFPSEYQDRLTARQGNVYVLEYNNRCQAYEYYNKIMEQNSFSVPANIADFLAQYGWHPGGTEYRQNITIPSSFIDKPSEIPIGLYFAYNNELSKSIGYDLEKYKGMDATAHIILLKEIFGDSPNKDTRAIVIEVSGSIAGAWLDKGRHYAFLASLDKKYFADITGKSWGQWLIDKNLVDYSSEGFEGKLKSISPEDVIREYYDAIDKKDFATAYSLISKSNQTGYLFANMPDFCLYNKSFSSAFNDGLENTLSAKIKDISELTGGYQIQTDKILNRNVYAKKEYMVNLDMTFKLQMTSGDGENTRFVILVKETPDAPWLIDSIGTGP